MILPITLSRDVAAAIGKGPLPDCLKSNPKLLLKFFNQAVQCEAWCTRSLFVFIKTGSAIYVMACAGLLHWDEVKKTIDYICEYFTKILLLPLPVTKNKELLSEANQFTKLLLARDGMLFRETPRQESFIKVHAVDFDHIVHAIITGQYEEFYSLDLSKLAAYMRQFAEWKNQRALNALQAVYCKRMNDCRSAVMGLFLAEMFDYSLIKEKAIEVIATTEFCVLSDKNGDVRYTYLSAGSSFDEDNKKLTLEERRTKDRVVLSSNRMQEAPIQCIDYHEPSNYVGFRVASSAAKIKEVRELYAASRKSYLPRDKTKRLCLDSQACVNADFLFGFLAYFNEVRSLELYDFKITKDFLRAISKIRKNLTYLRFQRIDNLTLEELNTLPELFPELTSLYFSGRALGPGVFEALKGLKKLDQLILTHCDFTLPDDLSLFHQILSLGISNVKGNIDFKRLWTECHKVEDLCVVGITQFDPVVYPYPDKILNISVHAKECENWIDEKGLILERLFPNLSSLYIYGNASSGNLAKATEKIVQNNQIKVRLLDDS